MESSRALCAAAALAWLALPAPALAAGEGGTCGGVAGVPCDAGLSCEMPVGRCMVPDMQGTCVRAPVVCTRDVRPVCGCDGKTYGNDCDRRAAKVSKARDGACR